jgi:superfamily II DNA or RNA helicase
LFRGGEDIFPKLWMSRVGKKGYSPACTNAQALFLIEHRVLKSRQPVYSCKERRRQVFFLDKDPLREHCVRSRWKLACDFLFRSFPRRGSVPGSVLVLSLSIFGYTNDLVAGYGHVIVDECHHLPAVSFERVLHEVKARYVVGLTATPYRRDGHQPIIHMQCGPVRFAVHPKSQEAKTQLKHQLICRTTDFTVDNPDSSIQAIYAALVGDEKRNSLLLADVRQAIQEGRSPVLLTERKEHLDILAESLQGDVKQLIVLSGRLSAKERRETMERLAAILENEVRLIAATGRYLGEGFDDPRLDTLILAMPFSWKGTIVQYAGRLHREHPEKQEVRVYDYIDANVPKLLRMYKKRLRGFRDIGYTTD